MRTNGTFLLLLLISAAGGWWAASILFGAESGWRNGGALVAVFVTAAVLAAVRRTSGWKYLAAGWLMLAVLIGPVMLFTAGLPGGKITPFGFPLSFTTVALIGLGIIAAALLFYGAMTRDAERLSVIVMGALLLALSFYLVFWLMVWDSTYDPIGMLLLPMLVLIAVLVGVALAVFLPRGRKATGVLFALLVPTSLILVTTLAQQPGFRTITYSRAGQVSLALERYHAREGHYPQTLRQLGLRDVIFAPPPVTLFGQGWCYESSGASYQLGYVDREHWSDPRLVARVAATAGDVTHWGPACAAEIDELIRQFPDYFVLRE